MPYDPELDKEIAKKELAIDGVVYEISLKSYNGGDAKVSIALQNSRFPVKRLTPKVFLAIAELVREMQPPT
jgi:hypothetical protein